MVGTPGPTPARENPFRASRLATLGYRLPPGWDWPRLLDRLDSLGGRTAIVGPHGHGKTTLLAALGRRLEERGLSVRRATVRRPARRLTAAQERHLFGGLGDGEWLLVDGAGALGGVAARALLRRSRAAAGLVLTRHRPGLLPTLLECETSPRLLADLVVRLAPALELPAHLSPEALHRRHAGDLRAALLELYDACAGRACAGRACAGRAYAGRAYAGRAYAGRACADR